MQATPKLASSAVAESTSADIFRKPVVVVWAAADVPATADVFTANGYAEWAERNHLSGDFPAPTAFYGVTRGGYLIRLDHTVVVSDYDAHDYATVTHTFTYTGANPRTYTTGCASRDGRA
jgi:hypothetical protein